MGGFSTLGGGISWEQIKQKLESEGAKNKAYDSDVDGVFDLGAIPTITRSKLEYPTENVDLLYLLSIGKGDWLRNILNHASYIGIGTLDSFADKALKSLGVRYHVIVGRFVDGKNHYYLYRVPSASTADFQLVKIVGGSSTTLASESVDLTTENASLMKLSISSSTLKGFREDMTTPKITATDTDLSDGKWGILERYGNADYMNSSIFGYLEAPSTQLTPPKAIIEVDELKQNLVSIANIDTPDHLKQEYKKYEILKSKGFTDEEIKTLFGDIQTHVDLASVTWGAFDHKDQCNTMLITIVAGNPYTGEKAIQEQIEHAKSKNLRVLKPTRDYKDVIEPHSQLTQEFTEWIAGKDNYAYQTLGHEDFEKFQVADTYYGNIVDGIKPDAYKRVPDWEMRRTLQMWKERLKRATVVKSEAEKHLKKLEEVEKKGW